jgi:prophage antirepressor-like protein
MNKLFTFNGININILGTYDNPMFFGSQIAKTLGYSNTKKAIYVHVWQENKMNVLEYNEKFLGTQNGALQNMNHQTILLNEFGMYQLIFASKLQTALIFQKWVMSDVLPTIRKTGAYKLPQLQHNQFVILNEFDLNTKVISYLRKYYTDILFNASLGENQDTDQKRINSWKLGYTSGMPDVIIYEHNQSYNGLSIELKSPKGKGVISEKQKDINEKMADRGFKTLISNDYDDIIKSINDYLSKRRFKCNRCRLKFHTTTTLKTHQKIIHRINNSIE